MNRDLLGNVIGIEELIAEDILSSGDNTYWFEGNDATIQGFRLYTKGIGVKNYSSGYHGVPGYYTIYKKNNDPAGNDLCLYHGGTTSIGRRLSRFYKEVKNMSRYDEKHPAGTKYRKTWGKDVSDVYVKVYPCSEKDVNEDVELAMIRSLRPLLNRLVTKKSIKKLK